MKKLVVLLLILIATAVISNGIYKYLPAQPSSPNTSKNQQVKIVSEESVVIDVVKKVSSSVVAVGIVEKPQTRSSFNFGPFSEFFNSPQQVPDAAPKESLIGSGFIVKEDGLMVTNKHVVQDRNVKYFVIDNKGNKYNVEKIYRDPLNDVAIIKVSNPPLGGFQKVELGDSDKLQVGQMVIAIGTALGEFRNTVTTGVVSGLGRGITAGNPFEGYVERLDNVIQTDAAINPGNSGGPLLNSSGQVIGIDTAIAQSGQNIGFAIPINVVKDSLKNFNETGEFRRPYLGVVYTMISKQAALLNDVPEGAYVRDVVAASPAEKAGVKKDDIIVKIDGEKVADKDGGLAALIAKKKVGDTLTLTIFRDGKTFDVKVALAEASGE